MVDGLEVDSFEALKAKLTQKNFEALKNKLETNNEYFVLGHMLGRTVEAYNERFTDEQVDVLTELLMKKILTLVGNAELGKAVNTHE